MFKSALQSPVSILQNAKNLPTGASRTVAKRSFFVNFLVSSGADDLARHMPHAVDSLDAALCAPLRLQAFASRL